MTNTIVKTTMTMPTTVDEKNSRVKTFPKVDPSQWPNGGPVYFCNAASAATVVTIPSSTSSIKHDGDDVQHHYDDPNDNDNNSTTTTTSTTSTTSTTTDHPPLPLGEPIEFETDHFRGKFLLRIRDLPSNPKDVHHEAYFEGKKRFFQMVVQGQFKTTTTTTSSSSSPLTFSDLLYGARYDRPFRGIPGRGSTLMKLIRGFVERANPGMVFDIASDRPRIMTSLGACQVLRVDRKGEEPDICHPSGTVEDTTLLTSTTTTIQTLSVPVDGKDFSSEDNNDDDNKKKDQPVVFTSAKDRRKKLAHPKYSSRFVLDPDLVYTFENYDDTVDLASYRQHFGRGMASIKVDLSDKLNGQPMSTTAMIKGTDKIIFDFHIWHERLWRNVITSEKTKSTTVSA